MAKDISNPMGDTKMLMELAGTCAQGDCNGKLHKMTRKGKKFYLCTECLSRYDRGPMATLKRCQIHIVVPVAAAAYCFAVLFLSL